MCQQKSVYMQKSWKLAFLCLSIDFSTLPEEFLGTGDWFG